jgi:branched-chain amino acid transport system ATP-binding protein
VAVFSASPARDPAAAWRVLLAADAGVDRHAASPSPSAGRKLTGGESGFGGIECSAPLRWTRLTLLRLVAVIALVVCLGLWRFLRSPIGTVLVAIRENEQRAGFIGYHTNRYKLLAFVASASLTALAGVLSTFNHRFASADPMNIAFSGELLAMVVIGGMRSFLGPALGALFYILFREFLSIYTANWLLVFGLLFVGFIVFSPEWAGGRGRARCWRPSGPSRRTDAAMAARKVGSARRRCRRVHP